MPYFRNSRRRLMRSPISEEKSNQRPKPKQAAFRPPVHVSAEEVFEVGLDWDGLVFLEVDLAIDGHAGSGGDEAADDDVSLRPRR